MAWHLTTLDGEGLVPSTWCSVTWPLPSCSPWHQWPCTLVVMHLSITTGDSLLLDQPQPLSCPGAHTHIPGNEPGAGSFAKPCRQSVTLLPSLVLCSPSATSNWIVAITREDQRAINMMHKSSQGAGMAILSCQLDYIWVLTKTQVPGYTCEDYFS